MTERARSISEEGPIRVLHVDDDACFLKTAKAILEMQGTFQVETALSVEEAMEKMKKEEYDVAVCDYQMPRKDGLQFLKELREKENCIPFVIFTGKGREEVAIRALNLGADHYENKNGDPEAVYCELGHAIRTTVERRRARALLSNALHALYIERKHRNIDFRSVSFVKTEIGAKNCLYPMPTTLVGALVEGKPNYTTIAHVGIMDPGSVSLGMNKMHFTNVGIRANGTFSVNIPSVKMVEETDYCGLISGKQLDKAELFKTFFGRLRTAPMIEECPINMECKLARTVDFPSHDIFIGEVIETYCDEGVLTNGILDLAKVDPILFAMNDRSYWKLGGRFAKAWSIGNKLKDRK